MAARSSAAVGRAGVPSTVHCPLSPVPWLLGGSYSTPMERARTLAIVEGLLAVLVWGASFIATKLAVLEVSPATLVWLRFAMGVVILGIAAHHRGELVAVTGRELAVFTGLGLIGITFHQWLQSNALVTAQASTSGWIVASTPIFIAILSRLVLREHLAPSAVAGIAMAAAGVVLVVSKGDLASLRAGHFGTPGDLLIVISAPNWAIFSVLSRRVLASQPPARVMFYVMAAGWLLSTPLLATGGGLGEVARLTATGWLSVAFLGIACSGLAYIWWYDALHRLPASQAGALLYLEPLVAMAVAAIVLGEPVRIAMILGGAVILTGVWLVNRATA